MSATSDESTAHTAGFQLLNLGTKAAWKPLDGVHMRGIFGSAVMVNLVELEPGAVVPLHRHPHEQVGFMLRGIQFLEVEGTEYELTPNDAYYIPGGLEHGGRGGPEGCLIIDVFQPVREDYRDAMLALDSCPEVMSRVPPQRHGRAKPRSSASSRPA
jgi:quercetin dioxygenase-like cupin family protein